MGALSLPAALWPDEQPIFCTANPPAERQIISATVDVNASICLSYDGFNRLNFKENFLSSRKNNNNNDNNNFLRTFRPGQRWIWRGNAWALRLARQWRGIGSCFSPLVIQTPSSARKGATWIRSSPIQASVGWHNFRKPTFLGPRRNAFLKKEKRPFRDQGIYHARLLVDRFAPDDSCFGQRSRVPRVYNLFWKKKKRKEKRETGKSENLGQLFRKNSPPGYNSSGSAIRAAHLADLVDSDIWTAILNFLKGICIYTYKKERKKKNFFDEEIQKI